MKIKNLKLRKTFFTIGLSITLMGCNNYEVKTINTEIIEEETEDNKIESNSIELEEKETETSKLDIKSIEYKENSYTTSNLNLRDDSNLEGNVIIVIDKCQKLMEVENLGEWSLVRYDEYIGYVFNKYIKTLPEDYIEVDISDQNIKYHLDDEIILDSDVVTGKQNVSDTRIGMFEIYSRETSRYLTGATYRSYVDYWMPFDGGIGLHDASWRDEFGGDIYINSGSHGCVNLPFEVAKTIYENSEVGTKVLVHK